jgi:hypothetical protein
VSTCIDTMLVSTMPDSAIAISVTAMSTSMAEDPLELGITDRRDDPSRKHVRGTSCPASHAPHPRPCQAGWREGRIGC